MTNYAHRAFRSLAIQVLIASGRHLGVPWATLCLPLGAFFARATPKTQPKDAPRARDAENKRFRAQHRTLRTPGL